MRWQPKPKSRRWSRFDYTAEARHRYLGANFYGALNARAGEGDPNPGFTSVRRQRASDNPPGSYLRACKSRAIDMWHQGVRGTLTYDSGRRGVKAVGSYRSLRYQQVTGRTRGLVLPRV
jgi:hypothetical protein